MSEKTIYVTEKHLTLRWILFALAILLAIGAFTYGITSIGAMEEGLNEITAETDKDVPYFASGVQYSYPLTGTNGEMKALRKAVTAAYTNDLKWAYKLLDPKTEYADFVNLATVNRHPGEWITVPEELCDILEEAASHTETLFDRYSPSRLSSFACLSNFNLYAGALYAEWDAILLSENAEEFDPARNEYEAERLLAIARATSGLNEEGKIAYHAKEDGTKPYLEFGSDSRVRLVLPQRYEAFAKEYEIADVPVLDLNVLHDAYLLELTQKLMAAEGYDQGVYATESGLLYSPSERLAFAFYTAEEEDLRYSYAITEDGVTRYRSRYFRTDTADFADLLSGLSVSSKNGSPTDAAYARSAILALGTEAEAALFVQTYTPFEIQYELLPGAGGR